MTKREVREALKNLEQAMDNVSMGLHSMSDPTDLQRAEQRGASSMAREVRAWIAKQRAELTRGGEL